MTTLIWPYKYLISNHQWKTMEETKFFNLLTTPPFLEFLDHEMTDKFKRKNN